MNQRMNVTWAALNEYLDQEKHLDVDERANMTEMRRFDKLKNNGNLRTEQEIWDINNVKKDYDIIR